MKIQNFCYLPFIFIRECQNFLTSELDEKSHEEHYFYELIYEIEEACKHSKIKGASEDIESRLLLLEDYLIKFTGIIDEIPDIEINLLTLITESCVYKIIMLTILKIEEHLLLNNDKQNTGKYRFLRYFIAKLMLHIYDYKNIIIENEDLIKNIIELIIFDKMFDTSEI